MQWNVRTPDGRQLGVEDGGDPSGRPVLVHHGTPSSRRAAFYPPWVQDAAERGLRLVSFDRPGYGDSSAHPGRTIAGSVADVRTICAELGIDRLVTWGYSGGGPYALACAALLPDLVTAAVSLAGLAPFEAEGFDWFAGKHPDDVEDTRLHLTDEASARRRLNQYRREFLLMSTGQPTDTESLPGGYHQFMFSCAKAALASGGQGWWDDNCTQLRRWGFDLADITVPVLLMHGRQDILVPAGHSEWMAEQIPGVETRWFDTDGHAALAQYRVPEAQAWLADRTSR